MRRSTAALLGVLVCASAWAGVKPGDMAPDDLGRTLQEQAVQTSALRGKVVVISFWATWCRYCLKELPTLVGLQSVATQRGLPMQVVAVDFEEPRDVFRRSVKLLQPKLPGLLMTWDRNGSIRKAFDSGDGIPVMVLLHRDGNVAQVLVGYDESDLDNILAQINALLNEPWQSSAPPTAQSQSP